MKKQKSCVKQESSFQRYLDDIQRIPLLSREEEVEISNLAAAGNKAAREKLVTANLRFVIVVARKYQGRGLPLLDLISEGNMGLMRAAKRFDPDKGYRFITYAVYWIRQFISKAIEDKGRMIRLPNGKLRTLHSMDKPKADKIRLISREVVSLDEPLGSHDPNHTRSDFIVGEYEADGEEKVANALLREQIEEIFTRISERDAAVLRCRFGLCEEGPMTLAEVGERYKLTRERIRQIEVRAMKIIRASTEGSKLSSYIA
ncbi:MAG: RNA polymerase sigma factor RpoD/SigA [Treponema sp.]|jgi:RNA polymerase primary sigma factor|nr:RNA polymerase sigma factor RpoD/SigA [Treponema sp.]